MEKTLKVRYMAREYFEQSGIKREELTREDFVTMKRIIEKHLNNYYFNGGEGSQKIVMKVADLRKKDVIIKNGALYFARIEINGTYFKRKEGVTFATSGQIKFGDYFSERNIEPIVTGFKEWVDVIKRGDIKEMMKIRES